MIISWDEHDMECEYEDHVKSSPFLWQSDTKMEWVTRSSLRSITFLCRTGAVIRALFHGTCSVSKKLAGVVQDVRKVPPPRVPSIPKEANGAWAKEERKDGDIQESVKRFEQRARITGLIPLKSFLAPNLDCQRGLSFQTKYTNSWGDLPPVVQNERHPRIAMLSFVVTELSRL